MASGPITSWQIDGEAMETVTDFIFLGPKITVDGDCNHEMKRHLLLGRKAMTNLAAAAAAAKSLQSCPTLCDPMDCSLLGSSNQPRQHIKKKRRYFANKGPSSQNYGFPCKVMYGCESWTIKKAELQRTDAFKLWFISAPNRSVENTYAIIALI